MDLRVCADSASFTEKKAEKVQCTVVSSVSKLEASTRGRPGCTRHHTKHYIPTATRFNDVHQLVENHWGDLDKVGAVNEKGSSPHLEMLRRQAYDG